PRHAGSSTQVTLAEPLADGRRTAARGARPAMECLDRGAAPGYYYIEVTSLPDRLRAIVGPRRVLERPSELLAYGSDALPGYQRNPNLAVFPGSREDVIAVVRELAKDNVPYVPRGAGTGLSGGALADGIVLLGLNRLRRIISVDTVNQLA